MKPYNGLVPHSHLLPLAHLNVVAEICMFNLIFLLSHTEIYEKALIACPSAIIEKACWVFNNKKEKKHKYKESKLHLNQHGKRFP